MENKINNKKLIKVFIPGLVFLVVLFSLFFISNNSKVINSLAKLFYEDEVELDNWEISTVFYDSTVNNGQTPLTEINWDASDGGYDTGETRTITVQINYKNSNSIQNYAPGDLKITIDNILSGYKTAQWDYSVNIGANDSTHIGYDWKLLNSNNKTSARYVFNNDINYDIHTNFEGSIQIVYTLTPAKEKNTSSYAYPIEQYDDYCEKSFNLSISAVLSDDNSNNSVSSNTLSFSYFRKYDHPWSYLNYTLTVRNEESKKVCSEDMFGENPDDYYWVPFNIYYSSRSTSDNYIGADSNTVKIDLNLPNDVLTYSYNGDLVDYSDYCSIPSNSNTVSFWVAFPKNHYNSSNNNLVMSNNLELYGKYKNKDNTELLATTEHSLDINRFIKECNSGNFTLSKSPAYSTELPIYYQELIKEDGKDFNWGLKGYVYNYDKNSNIDFEIGDDLLFIENNGNTRKLEENEYYFTSVSIPYLYNTSDISYSYLRKELSAELYVRYRGNNSYQKYDDYLLSNLSKTITFDEDERVVAWYVVFKNLDGSLKLNSINTKTRFTLSNIQQQGYIYNFSYMKAYDVNNSSDLLYLSQPKDYNNEFINNYINNYDMERYNNYLSRAYYKIGWNNYEQTSDTDMYSVKYANTNIVQDAANESFNGKFKVGIQLWGNGDGYSGYNKMPFAYDEEVTFKGYKIYDLLPPGVNLKSNSDSIVNSAKLTFSHKNNEYMGSSYSWEKPPYHGTFRLGSNIKMTRSELTNMVKTNSSVEIFNNWRNTGRTMLIITADLDDEDFVFFGSTGYADYSMGFDYEIDYSYSYDSLQEYGNVLNNYVYSEILSPSRFQELLKSVKDDGNNNININDINNNGSSDDYLSENNASVRIDSVTSTGQDVQVTVQSDLSNFDTGNVNTSVNSEYVYKLRARTGINDITNLVIYDSLEKYAKDPNMEFFDPSRGYTKWYGEFLGIDTTNAESKGYTIKTYYSEKDEPGNLKTDNSWKVYTDSVDKTKVKSLAFEYLDSNGNPAVIPANSITYVLIKMKSPSDEGIKTLAYNGCWTEWNAIDSITGETVDFITGINSNVVKVALPNSVEPTDIDITIDKYWKDNNNSLGIRPSTVNIQLVPDGDLSKTIDVPLGSTNVDNNNPNHWYTTISVPKYDIDSNLIDYSLREDEIGLNEGYKYTPSIEDNTITNILTKEIELKKIWKDNTNSYLTRPNSITYKIKQNNSLYKEVTFTGDYSTNEWTNTITVPVYDSSNREYNYSMEEVNIDNYSSNCEGFVCTNTLTGKDNINVSKEWVDNNNTYNTRPSSITIHLLRDNNQYLDVILNQDNNWNSDIEVDKYNSNGVKYTYTVSEDEVEEYGLVSYNQNSYKVTNTLKTNMNIVITKKWIDDNNSSNTRPNELVVTLIRNGEEYREITLSGNSDTWTSTVEVPKYDENQRKYQYSIKEITDGVNDDYSDITYDNLTITNKLSKNTNLTITKKWVDNDNKYYTRPSEVNIELFRDNELYKTIKLDGNNNTWKKTIEEVPVYDENGRKYNYSIRENNIDKYEKVTYDQTKLEVTNELTEVPTVTLYFTVVNGYVDPKTGEIKYDEFGLNEIIKKYNVSPNDEYIFNFELENVDTHKTYNGKLSTKFVLEFKDIPYGKYKVKVGKDRLFEFVDMFSIEDVNGVSFRKVNNEMYISIEPTGENIIYGAKIVNKIEAPMKNPKTGMNLFIIVIILISLIGGSLTVNKFLNKNQYNF